MFTNDCAVFWYHEFGINRYRVVVMTNQNIRLGKCWKMFRAALKPRFWRCTSLSFVNWSKWTLLVCSQSWRHCKWLHVKRSARCPVHSWRQVRQIAQLKMVILLAKVSYFFQYLLCEFGGTSVRIPYWMNFCYSRHLSAWYLMPSPHLKTQRYFSG